MAVERELVTTVNIMTTPPTALYTPTSVFPSACRTTREVNSPMAISRNILKYRNTVFRAIRRLLSDGRVSGLDVFMRAC